MVWILVLINERVWPNFSLEHERQQGEEFDILHVKKLWFELIRAFKDPRLSSFFQATQIMLTETDLLLLALSSWSDLCFSRYATEN